MIATKADVLAVAPCFSSLTADQFTAAFRLVGPLVNESELGARAPLAAAYRVAHFLACAYPDLAPDARVVVAEAIGPLSRQYAVAVPTSPRDLTSTKYGLAFLEIAGWVFTGIVG